MAYLNFIKHYEVELPPMRSSIDGFYQMRAFKGTEFPRGSGIVYEHQGTGRWLGGKTLEDGTEHAHSNLITNLCLENYGAAWQGSGYSGGGLTLDQSKNNGMFYCHVGTGTATPAVTDTTLQAFVAGQQVIHGLGLGTYWAQGSAPFYGAHRYKARFSPGFGGGNINLNEVGQSYQLTTGNLSSRALTVDGQGTPTTVTVLADEYLDVYYTRRNYPCHMADEGLGTPADDTGTVDIAGVTYNYTIRPSAVTDNDWGQQIVNAFAPATGFGSNSSMYAFPHNATLAPITSFGMTYSGVYAGNFGSPNPHGMNSYTTNSYNRTAWWDADIDYCNASEGGINGFAGLVVCTTMGAVQIALDGTVPKDNTKAFTYYHNWSWTRK
jgi:hypothetical protein